MKVFLQAAQVTHECRAVSWTSEILRPTGFTAVLAPEHGDIRPVWEWCDWADVILVSTSWNVRLLARFASGYALASRKPLFTVVHTSAHSRPGAGSALAQESWLLELCSASTTVVGVSEWVSASIEDLAARSGVNFPIATIENGSRLDFPHQRCRGRERVLFVGRPETQKGFDLYLHLAEDPEFVGLDFHANTVSVPYARSQPTVQLRCLTTDEELRAQYESADVFLAPYRYADGSPLAILEALAAGLPIIGSSSPAVGGLLSRYGQHVVAPTYEAFRAALSDWQSGRLRIDTPDRSRVPRWDDQMQQYLDLLTSTS